MESHAFSTAKLSTASKNQRLHTGSTNCSSGLRRDSFIVTRFAAASLSICNEASPDKAVPGVAVARWLCSTAVTDRPVTLVLRLQSDGT